MASCAQPENKPGAPSGCNVGSDSAMDALGSGAGSRSSETDSVRGDSGSASQLSSANTCREQTVRAPVDGDDSIFYSEDSSGASGEDSTTKPPSQSPPTGIPDDGTMTIEPHPNILSAADSADGAIAASTREEAKPGTRRSGVKVDNIGLFGRN
jgi:hypothetical protein